jgi:hypothetical protein
LPDQKDDSHSQEQNLADISSYLHLVEGVQVNRGRLARPGGLQIVYERVDKPAELTGECEDGNRLQ